MDPKELVIKSFTWNDVKVFLSVWEYQQGEYRIDESKPKGVWCDCGRRVGEWRCVDRRSTERIFETLTITLTSI